MIRVGEKILPKVNKALTFGIEVMDRLSGKTSGVSKAARQVGDVTPAGFDDDETKEIWQNIAASTLILVADDGLEHRIGHDNTEQYFNHHTYHLVTDAGHWTYHDQADQVLKLMDEFLC